MSAIDRVRVIVLGDSGVGKTSFVHLATHNDAVRAPGWTVGCSVEVKLHSYKEGTPEQTSYFVEFWDVGGGRNHRNARRVFYYPCHGVVLVHDLANRKSELNLSEWLRELLGDDDNGGGDAESLLGEARIPLLVIGTRLDSVEENPSRRRGRLAAQFDAEEIVLDCRQSRYLAAGTSNAVKLARFYDKVIERRYRGKDKFNSPVQGLPSKFYMPVHQD